MKRLFPLASARRPYFLRAARPAVFACIIPILGCSPQQQQQTADVIATARAACVSLGPLFQAAAMVPNPKVQNIVSYADAVCRPLAAGSVPATVDGNTATWLGSLAGMLRVLVPA